MAPMVKTKQHGRKAGQSCRTSSRIQCVAGLSFFAVRSTRTWRQWPKRNSAEANWGKVVEQVLEFSSSLDFLVLLFEAPGHGANGENETARKQSWPKLSNRFSNSVCRWTFLFWCSGHPDMAPMVKTKQIGSKMEQSGRTSSRIEFVAGLSGFAVRGARTWRQW